jgi:hypothetical protein
MSDLRIYKTFALLISLALFASACGSSQPSAIATSVAQTVQAGESLTEIAQVVPTATQMSPTPGLETALTSAITPTAAATLVSAPSDPNCVKATLVSENPPDGVLLKPGEYFWKTWTLKNTGTCTWTSAYKLIYWSGELMGGLTSYPLPVEVAPNEQKDITIYLQAPATDGTFTGYWRIQTPWESNFGVGPTDEPFYVEVAVSSATKVKYGVASVTYELVRNPPTGCPTNVRYEIFATISANGPMELHYFWNQSDGNESSTKRHDFTEASSITVSREWMIGKGDSPNPRWIQIIVTSPTYQEFDQVEILNNCS